MNFVYDFEGFALISDAINSQVYHICTVRSSYIEIWVMLLQNSFNQTCR